MRPATLQPSAGTSDPRPTLGEGRPGRLDRVDVGHGARFRCQPRPIAGCPAHRWSPRRSDDEERGDSDLRRSAGQQHPCSRSASEGSRRRRPRARSGRQHHDVSRIGRPGCMCSMNSRIIVGDGGGATWRRLRAEVEVRLSVSSGAANCRRDHGHDRQARRGPPPPTSDHHHRARRRRTAATPDSCGVDDLSIPASSVDDQLSINFAPRHDQRVPTVAARRSSSSSTVAHRQPLEHHLDHADWPPRSCCAMITSACCGAASLRDLPVRGRSSLRLGVFEQWYGLVERISRSAHQRLRDTVLAEPRRRAGAAVGLTSSYASLEARCRIAASACTRRTTSSSSTSNTACAVLRLRQDDDRSDLDRVSALVVDLQPLADHLHAQADLLLRVENRFAQPTPCERSVPTFAESGPDHHLVRLQH